MDVFVGSKIYKPGIEHTEVCERCCEIKLFHSKGICLFHRGILKFENYVSVGISNFEYLYFKSLRYRSEKI